MADSFIQIHQDGTGKKVDNSLLTIRGLQVYRQRTEVYAGETLPVSLAVAPITPVTGTFWQALQPVSLASTTVTNTVAVSGPLTNTELRAAPVDTVSQDFAGRRSFNTLFGEGVVGWHSDDISVMFQYNIATRDVTPVVTGSGAISNADEQAIIGIGSAIGTATLTSVDPIRYRPGHEVTAQYTSVYNGAQAGVNQYHGILNIADGVTFGTKDGVFGTWFIGGGIETFTPQSAWTGGVTGDRLDGLGESGFNIDPTKKNIYMVQYGWLGVAPIIYSVYTGHLTGWKIAHVIDRINLVTTPHLHNPSLPIAARVARTSGTGTAANIRTSSWRGGVTSGDTEDNSSNRWNAYTVLDASIVAGLARNNVFTIKNAATFQGKTNHVVVEIAIATFDNSGNKTVAFFGVNNAALTGHSAYVDVDANNSVISVSTGGIITSGAQGPATVIKAGSDRRTELLGTGIKIYPGQTFTFEAVAATFTGTISLSARWVEKF
jgi:hypothetical protein